MTSRLRARWTDCSSWWPTRPATRRLTERWGNTNALTSLTTNAGGTTHINGGSVETTGDQTYGDDVQLGNDTTLEAGG